MRAGEHLTACSHASHVQMLRMFKCSKELRSFCPGGGIGRHKGLKIPRTSVRAGSSPAPGTLKLKRPSAKQKAFFYLNDLLSFLALITVHFF